MRTFIPAISVFFLGLLLLQAPQAAPRPGGAQRPAGPCDIYAAAGTPCVAAHSTTRALYASYSGVLYQVMRLSDGKKLNIGVVRGTEQGGYADAAAQDRFCANTTCFITILYDQSGQHNDLIQAPRGGFSGPAMGGFNNLPIADMAPVTVMGHKVYGVFIAPGTGLRLNDAKGTAVDDQAEGQYWVINGHHFNSGCCFDYGNAEIDSRDDDNGTMETTYFGNATPWYHGNPPGPWVMTDQENNLVGCVNADGSKLCKDIPSVAWRFVTGIAKGEPHHWTSMGGDAQQGRLAVMYDGPRVDASYDPMRKQGAILLGNGGDNSNGSQGTFYEGAMTAGGTFPSDATDQAVQANVVAAHYDVARVAVAPASAPPGKPPGIQTFAPGTSQDVTVSYVNSGGVPVTGLQLALQLPPQWRAVASGPTSFAGPVAPGAGLHAAFKVMSGPGSFNGDLTATATWTEEGHKRSETAHQKLRNSPPVRINEFRIGDGPGNKTNAFIEIFNAADKPVDISNWTLTTRPSQQAVFSDVTVPAGTRLAAHGFYVLGLSNSGLATPVVAGDKVIHVRSIEGIKAGDSIRIGEGASAETRKVVQVGSAAGVVTPLWQPLPEGPVITIAPGATNVPVTSTEDLVVGEKIALGHGMEYPVVGRGREKYEVATVTAVGKPGTQAWLAADAAAGATNIKVTSTANISVGDRIRLDIDSKGHGIETVTVRSVGAAAARTLLSAPAASGATMVSVRNTAGFAVGHPVTIGTPAGRETVTVTAIGPRGPNGMFLSISPAITGAHVPGEAVTDPGMGLELAAPLKSHHAANLPFSVRGTGITFAPATAFAHSSGEPVRGLGSGLTLDAPLIRAHGVDAVVRDGAVTTAGYQNARQPDQWFGGPALADEGGSMALRDAKGMVVDSLNYGLLVDLPLAQGYQATSGSRQYGCLVPSPGVSSTRPPSLSASASAGRLPDGADTNSNCADFQVAASTSLPVGAMSGAANIKVTGVAGFAEGQTVILGSGADQETVVIAQIGTPGATRIAAPAAKGDMIVPVASVAGFAPGQTVTLRDAADPANTETASVAAVIGGGGLRLRFDQPLAHAHGTGTLVSGSGITLRSPVAHDHGAGAQLVSDLPTPGAPNTYHAQPEH